MREQAAGEVSEPPSGRVGADRIGVAPPINEQQLGLQATGVAATMTAQLLRLQATVGNRAVGAMLQRSRLRPQRRILAKYEPGEHVQFGTSGLTVPIAGMSGIDERYLIAMGDFYEDPDKLMSAKMDELKELMALIERDERARTGRGGTSPSEDEWQKWSEKWRPKGQQYMDLNKRNESHFSPRNKERWEKLHKEALKEAQSSANGSGVVSTRARIFNGFAAHYLTDAFAAGHLIDKVAVMELARKSLRIGSNRDDLASAIATGILANAGCVAKLSGKEIRDSAPWGDWGPPTQPRMAQLLSSIMKPWPRKEGEFLSVFARVVHDNLNEAISSGHGVWVQNQAGDRWQLSGDTTLNRSSQTLDIARKAVTASEDNLRAAARIKNPDWMHPFTPAISDATIQTMFDNVWRFVPRPTTTLLSGEGTETGDAQVKAAIKKFTDASDADTKKAITKLSIEQFDTALAQLKENDLIRDALKPAPAPAPPVTPPSPKPPPPSPPKHTHVIMLPDEVLHFEFDKATIDDAERDAVEAKLESELGRGLITADLSRPVQVRGYTDSVGNASYNQTLSQRRADAVKQIVEDKYPSLRGHVNATGLGSSNPVAPNKLNGRDNPVGRRQNRRVELEFQKVVEEP